LKVQNSYIKLLLQHNVSFEASYLGENEKIFLYKAAKYAQFFPIWSHWAKTSETIFTAIHFLHNL